MLQIKPIRRIRRIPVALMLAAATVNPVVFAQTPVEMARQFLRDLIRLDTTNPPGNETRAAQYMKRLMDREGIPAELAGDDPARLNFIARLHGSGAARPLLLMAHSDVVPADPSQWSVAPLAAIEKAGYIYGRGAEDDKSLLAAELAVMVDLHRRRAPLNRDIILLSEADEEAGSLGATWVVAHAWPKIDAEFALNEYSYILPTASGVPVVQIQTAEKIPTRFRLIAHGVAGHGSLPRDDNPVVHLARAIVRLKDAEQPVALNATTRAYLTAISGLPDYAWLRPLLPKLEDAAQSISAADAIRARDPEINAMLRFTVSPTMLTAGTKINVIPNVAEAQVDGRRLPGESHEEIMARLKRLVGDPAIDIEAAKSSEQPSTEPSSLTSPLYKAMEQVFREAMPNALVVPFLMRGTTDGAYLRAKGMAVYGVPLFRKDGELRMHGNDERISLENLGAGTDLLRKIVLRVAASPAVSGNQ
jgi:acetylornithine deacetylase/succinyl-diaminopimelate desuccinylase-like protein